MPRYVDKLAEAESRIKFTSAAQEVRFLRARMEESKHWLDFALLHCMWGPVFDAYAALPPFKAKSYINPMVKRLAKRDKKLLTPEMQVPQRLVHGVWKPLYLPINDKKPVKRNKRGTKASR